jgi:NitT/TauT family transport system substrate-binding protein
MGGPLLEAMGSNQWDIACCGPAAVFSVANTGLKIIADISVASGGVIAFIRPDHPAAKIKGAVPGYPKIYGSAATLKGAKVLVPVGSMNHYNVLQWISIFGMKPEDVNVVHMDNAPSFQAFKVGEGDITAFRPPLSYNAEAEGWVPAGVLHDLNIVLMDCLYANPRLYEGKKDLIIKFVKQMYRANDFFETDMNNTAKLLGEFMTKNGLNTTFENAKRDLSTRPWVTSKMAKGRVPGESMKMIAEFYTQVGRLEKEKFANFNSSTMLKDIAEQALK